MHEKFNLWLVSSFLYYLNKYILFFLFNAGIVDMLAPSLHTTVIESVSVIWQDIEKTLRVFPN